jgi:hypothetical protein
MTDILSLKKELLKARIHVHRQELKSQWCDNIEQQKETWIYQNINDITNITNISQLKQVLFDKITQSPILKTLPAAIFHEDARNFLLKSITPLVKKYQKPLYCSMIGIIAIGSIALFRYLKKVQKQKNP